MTVLGEPVPIERAHCAYCGYYVDCSSVVGQSTATPKNGDMSMCLYCGNVQVFDGGKLVRLDDQEEYVQSHLIPEDLSLLRKAQHMVRTTPGWKDRFLHNQDSSKGKTPA